jgi:outer membrane protein TolC
MLSMVKRLSTTLRNWYHYLPVSLVVITFLSGQLPASASIDFNAKQLPPEPAAGQKANSTLQLGPFHADLLIPIASLKPIQLEASYSQPITLKDALNYALQYNLPIKIARESWKYQKYQYLSALVSAVPIPNFFMGYSTTGSHTLPDINSNAQLFQPTIRYPVFQGGGAVYSAWAQYYRDKGWKQAYYASINDCLLDVYQKYNNLVLQHAVLHIRVKSVEVSQAQLKLNNAQYVAGTGTKFAIMQSRTQLATDKQALLQQQIIVRQAALALAFALNLPMAVNLVPEEASIQEALLIDRQAPVAEYMQIALNKRPELRQYEMFHLAGARSVQIAASGLYPQASFFTTYTHSKTIVNPPGGNVAGVAVAQINSAINGPGTASNNALGQTASFSPTSSTTANAGANNTISTPVVAASGGMPLNVIQSGSLVTSGAVAPSIAGGNGSGGFSSSNVNGSNTAGPGVFPGVFNTYQAGWTGSYNLNSIGLGTVASTLSAEALVPQALQEANQELLLVEAQVRADYVSTLSAKEQIDNGAYGIASSGEALRIAGLRLNAGMATNLELIQAQRDYINALITQAQAIESSNLAQAQLVHDIGTISVETLTRNYQ